MSILTFFIYFLLQPVLVTTCEVNTCTGRTINYPIP